MKKNRVGEIAQCDFCNEPFVVFRQFQIVCKPKCASRLAVRQRIARGERAYPNTPEKTYADEEEEKLSGIHRIADDHEDCPHEIEDEKETA